MGHLKYHKIDSLEVSFYLHSLYFVVSHNSPLFQITLSTRSSECTYETVERFDTFRQQWLPKVAPMAIGRILPGVVALDGLIYVVGGEQESQILANGEVYNPQEDKWSKVKINLLFVKRKVLSCHIELTKLWL